MVQEGQIVLFEFPRGIRLWANFGPPDEVATHDTLGNSISNTFFILPARPSASGCCSPNHTVTQSLHHVISIISDEIKSLRDILSTEKLEEVMTPIS